ncbi:MAG: hypothetical protein ACXAEX_07315 [Promethearchaeota archaeon]|jgi:hypothetical protein
MANERIEIVDFSGEKFSNLSLPCWVLVVLVPSIAILSTYLMVIYPGSTVSLLLSIALIGIFILYYYFNATKSPGKLRKFSISSTDIELMLPDKPQFNIKWAEFDTIEIKLKKLDLKPFYVYHFHFKLVNLEKKVSISLLDFPKVKINEILKALKEYARVMKKDFTAVKETRVSGIYLVEDLEIM